MPVGPSRVQGRISQRKLSLKEPGVHINGKRVGHSFQLLGQTINLFTFCLPIHPPEISLQANAQTRLVRRRGAGKEGGSGDVPCLQLLEDYNSYMCGVDQADQIL